MPTPTESNQPFQPTAEWVASWKSKLPLTTCLRLIEHLCPQIISKCELAPHGNLSENEIIAFIKDTTMVGLLPVPHQIVIRAYNTNQYTSLWFTTFTWGVLLLRHQGKLLLANLYLNPHSSSIVRRQIDSSIYD